MSDTASNFFVGSGDAATMNAFTPDPATPAAGPNQGYTFFNTDDQILYVWDRSISPPDWTPINQPAVELIETLTPTGTGTITFSDLGAFSHLEIRFSGRSTEAATATDVMLRFNADTGNNYDRELLRGAGTTAAASEDIGQTHALIATLAGASATSGLTGSGTIVIPNYRDTNLHKTATSFNVHKSSNSSSGTGIRCWGAAWRNTAAITSITLALTSGNYAAGTKFSLYGLR